MSNVIFVQFGDRPKITREDYLQSAERNRRAARQYPALAPQLLRLAEARERQARSV